MQRKKLVVPIVLCFALISVAFAGPWHELFTTKTEVTAVEGVTVWFTSPGAGEWWEVTDELTCYAEMKPGDVEKFYIKIDHAGDTQITLMAKITFPSEIEMHTYATPGDVEILQDGKVYIFTYDMAPGIIGGDLSIWIEYRLAGWADLGTYTIDFVMWRG